MNQLVNPNLNAVGRIGFCLEYQARVWGTTSVAPYAWMAWMETKYPRYDPPPTDVSFPLWFSFYSGGINQGHVVSYVPGQGYYSSPWQTGTTHAVLSSIAEVERIYGATYVGWSEDILNLRVVGETMWSNGDTYNLLYRSINAGVAEEAKAANYVGFFGAQNGQEFKSAFYDIINSIQYGLMVQGAQAPTGFTPYSGAELYVKA